MKTETELEITNKAESLKQERDALKEALKDANDALRSAHEVCKREGKDTRWPELTARIKRSLESQHTILHPSKP